MKVIAYLTSGARAKPLSKRWTVPVPRPEGEILGERNCGNILTTIIRWRHGDGWEWRAVETNGTSLWFYELVPDSNGNVLKPRAIDAFCVLPGYEAMIEGVTPLAPDDPDRLIVPDADRAADLAHWRAKYVAASEAAASLGAIKSERKAAASRANGAKGGRPQSDLSRAVDEAINILCREHPDRAEWPNLFRALTRRGLSLAGRAARIADILASLGWESDPRFGALFDALNREPDEAD